MPRDLPWSQGGGSLLMSEVPLYLRFADFRVAGQPGGRRSDGDGLVTCTGVLQGYLAHKKSHPPLRTTIWPWAYATVGSQGERVSYEQSTPVPGGRRSDGCGLVTYTSGLARNLHW